MEKKEKEKNVNHDQGRKIKTGKRKKNRNGINQRKEEREEQQKTEKWKKKRREGGIHERQRKREKGGKVGSPKR